MHVINKLTPDWVWTTFENRNNPKYTVTNDAPPKPMINSTGPTEAAKPVNSSYQQQYPNLAQYELIGVQYDRHQAEPKLLANSQLESAFQAAPHAWRATAPQPIRHRRTPSSPSTSTIAAEFSTPPAYCRTRTSTVIKNWTMSGRSNAPSGNAKESSP